MSFFRVTRLEQPDESGEARTFLIFSNLYDYEMR